VIGLAECGTHAIFDAVIGAYTTGENTLARELIAKVPPRPLGLRPRECVGL
jgi:hypothetical protein